MKTRAKRTDEEYEIEALSKGLLVLEALEGKEFEPVTVAKIIERTELSRDLVTRSLKTLRLRGYAAQNEDGEWAIARRFISFAELVVQHKQQVLNSQIWEFKK